MSKRRPRALLVRLTEKEEAQLAKSAREAGLSKSACVREWVHQLGGRLAGGAKDGRILISISDHLAEMIKDIRSALRQGAMEGQLPISTIAAVYQKLDCLCEFVCWLKAGGDPDAWMEKAGGGSRWPT